MNKKGTLLWEIISLYPIIALGFIFICDYMIPVWILWIILGSIIVNKILVACYICRYTIVFRKDSELYKQIKNYTYEYITELAIRSMEEHFKYNALENLCDKEIENNTSDDNIS